MIEKTVGLITRLGANKRLTSEMRENMKESMEIRNQLRKVISRSLNQSGPEATLLMIGIECKKVFGEERLEMAYNAITPRVNSH